MNANDNADIIAPLNDNRADFLELIKEIVQHAINFYANPANGAVGNNTISNIIIGKMTQGAPLAGLVIPNVVANNMNLYFDLMTRMIPEQNYHPLFVEILVRGTLRTWATGIDVSRYTNHIEVDKREAIHYFATCFLRLLEDVFREKVPDHLYEINLVGPKGITYMTLIGCTLRRESYFRVASMVIDKTTLIPNLRTSFGRAAF
jgi:hypothetical protein